MPSPPLMMTPNQIDSALQQSVPLQHLLERCRSQHIPIYLVGGAIRDLLYKGMLSKDLDVVVPATQAKTLAESIAADLDGKCICLDPQYHIYRVIVFPELVMLDIAGCIGESIYADLTRRDLTVNAMGYDFQEQILLDPFGGQADLAEGLIRMISPENLLDDPLRLLRVFRIAAELQFTQIDPSTLDVVRHHGEKLMQAAPERIHYEMMKLLSVPISYPYLRLMGETGLLEHIFPELAPTRQVPPNLYHHLELFDHTLELVKQAEVHFVDFPEDLRHYLMADFNPFTKRIALVRLACLFHDIGKPATMVYEPETLRYKFYRHEEVSEELTYGIAIRLKWGKDIAKLVGQMVRWHLYPGDMLKSEVTPKAVRKFFRRIEACLPELLVLALADRYSAQGPALDPADLPKSKEGLMGLWAKYKEFQAEEAFQAKLLSGQDVMTLLNIPPGPQIGQILAALKDAQLNGEVTTVSEAEAWVTSSFASGERPD